MLNTVEFTRLPMELAEFGGGPSALDAADFVALLACISPAVVNGNFPGAQVELRRRGGGGKEYEPEGR